MPSIDSPGRAPQVTRLWFPARPILPPPCSSSIPASAGLSILRPALDLMQAMPVVYAADNAGFPYGTKSDIELAARVPALLGRLVERYRPRIAVIACNTASTIALAHVRAALDIPVVGTVPAIKPAALASKSRVIGVLGTDATVRQPYVDRLAAEHGADCIVLRHGSAALVAYVEARLRGGPADPAIPADALAGLTDQPGGDRMDMVVLACTHFPLVEDELVAAAAQPLRFLDGGAGIARRIAYLNGDAPWPGRAPPGKAVFTRLDSDVATLAPALARYGLHDIQGL